jgi:cyclopropane fatty-acyl-phospholipid synthase-like methyltransferase
MSGLKDNPMYDQKFWNERYATTEYLYGTEANTFLVENAHLLRGPVLSLSEGEGRNAVFIASRGLHVLGVDCSEVGLEKAQTLAQSRGLVVETEVADLDEYQPKERHFGSVVSIFAHLPSSIRRRLYPLIEKALKPNGIVLLEAYSENQLGKNTGGPKDIDMLMRVETLRQEFPNLKPVLAREIDREVSEGEGHTGMASVVQFIARNEA